MDQDKQETREEEVARVRSYLANQAMKRTVEQIVITFPISSPYMFTCSVVIRYSIVLS